MRVMVERVAVMALMALAIIANFWKQHRAAAADTSFVSAAGSLILGQLVLAAFLPPAASFPPRLPHRCDERGLLVPGNWKHIVYAVP